MAGIMAAMNDGELYKHKSHPYHELRFHLKSPGAYNCSACHMRGLDPCLKCINEYCDFHLHKACYHAEKIVPQPSHFFNGCNFEYDDESLVTDNCEYASHCFSCGLNSPVTDNCENARHCLACGLNLLGLGYRCQHDPGTHYLHPTCAFLKSNDQIENENGLKFELQDKVKSKCLHCRKKYPVKKCMGITGLKWVCKTEEWSFPFCFTGRKVCYHLKCMNEILSARGQTRISFRTNLLQYL